MSWISKKESPKEPVRPETINPSDLIYGSRRNIPGARRAQPEDAPPAETDSDGLVEKEVPGVENGGASFRVSLKKSSDPFLRSGRQAWIYRIRTPEAEEITGSARSRRRAERKIRWVISRERVSGEKLQSVREFLRVYDSRYRLPTEHEIVENPTFRLTTLPGGYKAITYAPRPPKGWGAPERSRPRWEAAIFSEEHSICVRAEKGSRRKALRSARQKLNEWLARQELGQEKPRQDRD